MADEQSPAIEIAPTIVLNSNESGTDEQRNENSGNADDNSDGDNDAPQSEQVAIASIEAERDITLAAITQRC
jgi:hypothetical protein